eukprot:Blabericola_migrator_1__8983@NODE_477_length_8197_cov_77_233948_g371_i0_p2_GENE_NODE_477_length_8197_cov_77_233948_g371_i0NODE_477_length_8197_cov_77_233948_g371_i0_p2_ORF_typecomplete_len301_score71_45Met_asp_mut_E/PF06368_11/0_053DUF5601/PF18151_1/1_4DUF5601/PF18151_1/1_4e04AKAP_110/PF05716_13/15_NODE_477_length_8197_cov_77_233948_g371_i048950
MTTAYNQDLEAERLYHQVVFDKSNIKSFVESPWCQDVLDIIIYILPKLASFPGLPRESQDYLSRKTDAYRRLRADLEVKKTPEKFGLIRRVLLIECFHAVLVKAFLPEALPQVRELMTELVSDASTEEIKDIRSELDSSQESESMKSSMSELVDCAIQHMLLTEKEECEAVLAVVGRKIGVTESIENLMESLDKAIMTKLLDLASQMIRTYQLESDFHDILDGLDTEIDVEKEAEQDLIVLRVLMQLVENKLVEWRDEKSDVWEGIRTACVNFTADKDKAEGIIIGAVKVAVDQAMEAAS